MTRAEIWEKKISLIPIFRNLINNQKHHHFSTAGNKNQIEADIKKAKSTYSSLSLERFVKLSAIDIEKVATMNAK